MSLRPNAYQAYKQTQIETAAPEKLVLMLYNGALNKLKKAKSDIETSNLIEAHLNLIKVQDILLELMLSLDWSVGGELPSRLHALYDFMYRRLVQANIKKEIKPIDEVLNLLTELKDTWYQMMINSKAGQTVVTKEEPLPTQAVG